MVWGKDDETYNYVKETSIFAAYSFFTMQITRCISVLVLFAVWCLYFYIYVRSALYQYSFVALTVTLLGFIWLFIGSGK